jgi:putative ABC transport system permease protein
MNIPYVSWRNLRRNATRTWLLFAIVVVVSCTLFGATVFLKSIRDALRLGTYRLGADVLVVPEGAETKAKAALLSGEQNEFRMPASVLDAVRRVDGVKQATPQLFVKPTSFTCCYDVGVFLVAFDPESDFTVRPWLEKHLHGPLGRTDIVTGRDIPVVSGDRIPFFGTFFRVAGTMAPTGMPFFDQAAFMTLDGARDMAAASRTRAARPLDVGDQISTVLVRTTDELGPDRVAIRIEHDVPGVKAIVSDTVVATVRRQLSGIVQGVVTLSAVLWIIVLLVMAFAFTMIVNERRREIGLLRAMGGNRRQVATLLLTEASLLSAAGGAAGIAAALALLVASHDLMLHRLKLPYLFPPAAELGVLTAVALVLALVTGVASALLPAVSAIRTPPYDAIRRAE